MIVMFTPFYYNETLISSAWNSISVSSPMNCLYGNLSCSRMSSPIMGVFTYFFDNESLTNIFVFAKVDLKQNGPDLSLLNPCHHNLS